MRTPRPEAAASPVSRPRDDDRAIRRALLQWFRRHARPLPWRTRRSPYPVWVSEVMLQQTRVETVIPYYRRFLRVFPTLASLAKAPRERVLELWSGLGYYRRARHLHQAARILARHFGGRFPRDYAQARSLPGVGDYTARAVLSVAYNLPFAVLDGNVARVVARLGAFRGSFNQPRFRRAVERKLDRLLSSRQPGDFNQALMELGQTVCVPRAPRCPVCPWRRWCQAYRRGRPESFPAPRARRATRARHLASAVIRRGRQVAMVRGLDDGLLTDLWNFPSAFGNSRRAALRRLKEKLAAEVRGSIRFGAPLGELRHGITYRAIRVHLYPAEISPDNSCGAFRWFPLPRLSRAAVSQLARKTTEKLLTGTIASDPLVD